MNHIWNDLVKKKKSLGFRYSCSHHLHLDDIFGFILTSFTRPINLILVCTEDIRVRDRKINMKRAIQVSAYILWYLNLDMLNNIEDI